ncbi:MAG: bacterioferritin [Planctomycetota bacterium]
MQGDAKVIDALNELLTSELTAINQYYVHYKMCENWGFLKLAAYFREESVDEMKHADKIIDRILYLDGVPNMQRYNTVLVGEDVPEQIKLMLDTEVVSANVLNALIKLSADCGDNGTREMMESLLVDTEQAVDWAEAQLHIIKEIGKERYLAEKLEA